MKWLNNKTWTYNNTDYKNVYITLIFWFQYHDLNKLLRFLVSFCGSQRKKIANLEV